MALEGALSIPSCGLGKVGALGWLLLVPLTLPNSEGRRQEARRGY